MKVSRQNAEGGILHWMRCFANLGAQHVGTNVEVSFPEGNQLTISLLV